jgi:hypothetical protein
MKKTVIYKQYKTMTSKGYLMLEEDLNKFHKDPESLDIREFAKELVMHANDNDYEDPSIELKSWETVSGAPITISYDIDFFEYVEIEEEYEPEDGEDWE